MCRWSVHSFLGGPMMWSCVIETELLRNTSFTSPTGRSSGRPHTTCTRILSSQHSPHNPHCAMHTTADVFICHRRPSVSLRTACMLTARVLQSCRNTLSQCWPHVGLVNDDCRPLCATGAILVGSRRALWPQGTPGMDCTAPPACPSATGTTASLLAIQPARSQRCEACCCNSPRCDPGC
jgi:hypothetical protein